MPFKFIPNELLGRAINDAEFRGQLVTKTTVEDARQFLDEYDFASTSDDVAQEIVAFNTDPDFQASIRQELGVDETAM